MPPLFVSVFVSAAVLFAAGCATTGEGTPDSGRASVAQHATLAATRPNVVLVVVDDWGWSDAGFQGSGFYETPHMDALAADGLVFRAAYSAGPNCAPSRASLMTGRVTPRHGILTVGTSKRGKARDRRLVPIPNQTVLADEEQTVAELLRAAGYRTAHLGKWHLGDDPRTQGFDRNRGGTKAGHPKSYVSPYRNPALRDGPEGEYLTDRLTDEALAFLDEQSAADRPFFLHLSHFAVHTPIQARAEDEAPYLDRAPVGGQGNAAYAGMLVAVDRSLGRLCERLTALGLADDTLVLLTSDNGGLGTVTSNAPLRGMKGMLYEGGVRVPFVAHWPGRIAPGGVSDEPIHGVDLLPTLAALAGVPAAGAEVALDGLSLLPAFEGRPLERDALFWHFPAYLEGNRLTGRWRTTPVGAIRAGRWKLLEWFETGRFELYDLERDPGESRDLASDQPERVAELAARLASWREEVGARVPRELEWTYSER